MTLETISKTHYLPSQLIADFTSLPPETCQKLHLDKKYTFSERIYRGATIYHELGHFIDPSMAPHENWPTSQGLTMAHRWEMFADVFSTLMTIKLEGKEAARYAEALADWRSMQPLHILPEEVKDLTPPWVLRDDYMTARGIRAAVKEYKNRAGTKESLESLSIQQIAKLANRITEQYRFTWPELKEISDDIIQANAKLEMGLAERLPESALQKPLDAEQIGRWVATSQLSTSLLSPYPPEERMERLLKANLLDIKKPWVREMAAAWEAVVGKPVITSQEKPASSDELPPRDSGSTSSHVTRLSRRDFLAPWRS